MITVIGSLNLDFFIETPHLPAPGETVLGRRFRQAPGGKGANQACAAGRLASAGQAIHLIGCVGDDNFGRELTDNLARFGASPAGIIRRAGVSSGIAFIAVDDQGGNQIIVAGGANATLTPDDISAQMERIQGARVVVAQWEVPLPSVEAAFRIARAAGAITVLNPAPAAGVPDEFLRLCDWIVPNESEAATLTGRTLRAASDAPAVAAALRERAPQAGILITLGAAGAWLDHGGRTQAIVPFPVKAIDTVGAGDTFVGAFAVGLAEGISPPAAARFAAAAAALAVTKPGAQAGIPTRAEVEGLLNGRAA